MAEIFKEWWPRLVAEVKKELKETPLSDGEQKKVLVHFVAKKEMIKEKGPFNFENTFLEHFGIALAKVVPSERISKESPEYGHFFETLRIWIEANPYGRY